MYHPKHHAQRWPDKPAYIMAKSGRVVTYKELDEQTNRIAQLFRSLGVQAGDHIAIMMENNEHFMQIAWGAQRSGVIYTAVSTHLKRDEVAYILQDSDSKLLVVSPGFVPLVESLREAGTVVEHVFVTGSAQGGCRDWAAAVAGQPPQPVADEQAGARMLYTSGTTGRPKGVLSAFEPGTPIDSVSAKLLGMAKVMSIDSDTVYLSPAPLYHAAPLGFVLVVMQLGGTCVLMEKFDPEEALRNIEKFAVTHSQWVPIMFVRLLALPEEVRSRYKVSSMRVAIHAAAPCPTEVKRQMIDWWGPVISEYYAATESIGFTAIHTDEWLKHPGSVGRAIGSKVHIVGEDGEEVPTGQIGDVYFEAAARFAYYKNEAKTADSYNRHGWASVGDVGYVDAEGYLYLTDRKNFMIISGGVNIYPQEVENLLITHEEVADVAVFGVPNVEFGEEVMAVVQPRQWPPDSPRLEAELIAWCRERLANLKVPRTIKFEARLPREDNGKLYKRELITRYGKPASP